MVKQYIPDRGDLVWLSLDPTLGHEQRGRRPVMIVSSVKYNKVGIALVCPITSQMKGYPFEVILETKKIEGAILSDQVRAVDWDMRRAEFIESVNSPVLLKVQKNLSKLIFE